jgi:hypothetical protein
MNIKKCKIKICPEMENCERKQNIKLTDQFFDMRRGDFSDGGMFSCIFFMPRKDINNDTR